MKVLESVSKTAWGWGGPSWPLIPSGAMGAWGWSERQTSVEVLRTASLGGVAAEARGTGESGIWGFEDQGLGQRGRSLEPRPYPPAPRRQLGFIQPGIVSTWSALPGKLILKAPAPKPPPSTEPFLHLSPFPAPSDLSIHTLVSTSS